MTAIGPRQRAALDRLKWRPEMADADDDVMRSLARRGLAHPSPAMTGAEWHITHAGCFALGCDQIAADEAPTPLEIALVDHLNARLRTTTEISQ